MNMDTKTGANYSTHKPLTQAEADKALLENLAERKTLPEDINKKSLLIVSGIFALVAVMLIWFVLSLVMYLYQADRTLFFVVAFGCIFFTLAHVFYTSFLE